MHNATKIEKFYRMPLVRVELVVLSVIDERLQVLLGQREEDPHKNKWGLPGGVLRIDLDSTLEAAALRVARERLNEQLTNLAQVAAVGGPDRDPRAPWGLSVVFRSMVQTDVHVAPGKRVKALQWRAVSDIGDANDLAFDHADLIAQAVEAVRREVAQLRFPDGWKIEPFTYGDLQALSEAVLGVPLDKVTFRRRMDASGMAAPLAGQMRSGGPFRPAQLYKFALEGEG